jgi:CDP-diacylglycerol--glycerol-3-phosphate 3-phosphatidyltransferase
MRQSANDHFRKWSQLHGGAQPTGLIAGWLRIMVALTRPLITLGMSANQVTVAGLLVGLSALIPAYYEGCWIIAAAVLIGISGIFDGLDGAVAIIRGKITKWGSVLDSCCDRLADTGYVLTLWLIGAPGWLTFGAMTVTWLQEYLRARAAVSGMPEIGVITIAERPTRVLIAAMFALGAGIFASASGQWATAGAAAWTITGTVGVAQLSLTVHRALTRSTD